MEALIKYREAATTSSPGLPSRLPWVSNFNTPQPRWGCVLLHSSSQRSRRAATLGWRLLPLRGIRLLHRPDLNAKSLSSSLIRPLLKFVGLRLAPLGSAPVPAFALDQFICGLGTPGSSF